MLAGALSRYIQRSPNAVKIIYSMTKPIEYCFPIRISIVKKAPINIKIAIMESTLAYKSIVLMILLAKNRVIATLMQGRRYFLVWLIFYAILISKDNIRNYIDNYMLYRLW